MDRYAGLFLEGQTAVMGADISFADHVRIVDASETRRGGWAGRQGQCWGITTPSITGVRVIGGTEGDLAFNIHFDEDTVPDAWFHPDLVEYVDRAAGTDMTVGDLHVVRDSAGDRHPAQDVGPR
jgi:hypothetical protein